MDHWVVLTQRDATNLKGAYPWVEPDGRITKEIKACAE